MRVQEECRVRELDASRVNATHASWPGKLGKPGFPVRWRGHQKVNALVGDLIEPARVPKARLRRGFIEGWRRGDIPLLSDPSFEILGGGQTGRQR